MKAHTVVYTDDSDPEGFHGASDALVQDGLQLIYDGADPKRVSAAALQLCQANLTRWYA